MNHSQCENDSSTPQSSSMEAVANFSIILSRLARAWKFIAIMGLVGLIIACIYIYTTLPRYEAVVQIKIIKLPLPNGIFGVNIEEPSALIARMSKPSAFSDELIVSCGFEAAPRSRLATIINKSVKFENLDGTSAVLLKVNRPVAELSKVCATNIAKSVYLSQMQVLKAHPQFSPGVLEARLRVVTARINEDEALLAKAEKVHNSLSPTLFALLVDVRALQDERDKIIKLLDISNELESVSSKHVEVSSQVVPPFKEAILAAGLLAGLFWGVLIALIFARSSNGKIKSIYFKDE